MQPQWEPNATDLIRAAQTLWGDATNKTKTEWRFGSHGSKSIDLVKLTWYDHQELGGGGVIDLMKRAGLAPEASSGNGSTPLEIAYPYENLLAELLCQVVRKPGHKFLQRRPDGNGGWIWDTKGVDDTLYRWPQLEESAADDTQVFIPEGEKDVDNLRALGLTAVCNRGGAGKWKAELNEPLRDRRVVILPDKDEAGRKHADAVAAQLLPIARSVLILELPGLTGAKNDKDVSDWLAHHGGTQETLLELVGKVGRVPGEPVTPVTVTKPVRMTLEALAQLEAQPPVMVVPRLFVEGLTLFAGKPKVGKSWLMLHAGLAVAQAGTTLGEIACGAGDVLYCALEDTFQRLKRRVDKLDAGWPARMWVQTEMPRLAAGGLEGIREWITSVPAPRLVIIDTLELVRDRKTTDNGYAADYAAVLELRKLANAHHLAIVVVHHLRKAEAEDPFDTVSGTLGLTGAPDAILVLTREAGVYTLRGRGRDLEEFESGLSFDRTTCLWRLGSDLTPVSAWDGKKNLTLLRRALMETVAKYGIDERPFPDGPLLRVVDLERVRSEFYAAYPATERGTPEQREDTRQKAFRRSVNSAVNQGLIGSREIRGIQMLWFAAPSGRTPA
jgi:hypothetical protein